ncbi:MAG: alpha/beta fold hydrolase [Comamonadaceae bacterium]|nr:alpha/beta fold hydrolase [Comamonadaceae bacterium]
MTRPPLPTCTLMRRDIDKPFEKSITSYWLINWQTIVASFFSFCLVAMLARLLRQIYFLQLVSGALMGAYLAGRFAPDAHLLTAASVVAGALLLPLLLQVIVIVVSMVRSDAGGQSSLWWRAFWGELGAALRVYLFRQPWSVRSLGIAMPVPHNTSPQPPQKVPVVLVHGYFCNHRVWDDVAPALQEAGHTVLAIDLEPLFTSIDDYAPLIDQAVTALADRCNAGRVALVGHSMGGLAIRAWMRAHGNTRVAGVITLGSPHQGTRIAKQSITANGAQMVWHSDWLQMLERSETKVSRQMMQIALTPQDNIVFPQCEQVLAGASVTQFSGLGHLEMCLDRHVIAWLTQRLATLDT